MKSKRHLEARSIVAALLLIAVMCGVNSFFPLHNPQSSYREKLSIAKPILAPVSENHPQLQILPENGTQKSRILSSNPVVTTIISIVGAYSSNYTFSGQSVKIFGTVIANGTGIANSTVTIGTPWGTFYAETNSAGEFAAKVPVPILEYGKQIFTFSVAPPSPDAIGGSAMYGIQVVNSVELIDVVVLIGLAVYVARRQSLVERVRRSPRIFRTEPAPVVTQEEPIKPSPVIQPIVVPPIQQRPPEAPPADIPQIYDKALRLAEKKFGTRFSNIMTTKEIERKVTQFSEKAGASDEGLTLFFKISSVAEDYAYSKNFDKQKGLKEASDALDHLRQIWGAIE